MLWPVNSPDQNPIENFWLKFKNMLHDKASSTKDLLTAI